MKLLTYPARPTDGGKLEKARRKFGTWAWEPKANGWRSIVYLPERRMWNRHGNPLSITGEFSLALECLDEMIGTLVDWVDVEVLSRRHDVMQGGLVVLDLIMPGTYLQRREVAEGNLSIFDMEKPREEQESSAVCLIPSFRDGHEDPEFDLDEPMPLWLKLQEDNDRLTPDWRKRPLNCFYEGIVAKRVDSTYPVQLISDTKPFGHWMKHRFV